MNPSLPQPQAGTAPRLFRAAALQHAAVRSHGTVLLVRPVSHTVLTAVFVALAAAIVAFVALFSVARKAQVPGVLLPSQGLIRVVPGQPGRVVERRVNDGQAVRAGDVLFLLANERSSTTRGAAERAISSLLQFQRDSFVLDQGQQRQQTVQRMDAAGRRADDLSADALRIDEQIALQERRVALAAGALQRYADLQAADFVSPANVQDRQAEWLDQRQRLAELQRARAVSRRELDVVQAELQDLAIQARRDSAAVSRSIAAIDQDLTENEARREVLVRAAQDGTVTAITAEAGETVAATQALASLLPAGSELVADLYAPSRSAGFIRPGMSVLLRYPAFPYQKFGQHRGEVIEVSAAAMRPQDLTLAGSVGEQVYRVRVRLDRQSIKAYGQDQALKAGMTVEASVVLERRRLYEWILEPLYSITGRL